MAKVETCTHPSLRNESIFFRSWDTRFPRNMLCIELYFRTTKCSTFQGAINDSISSLDIGRPIRGCSSTVIIGAELF